MTSGTSNQVTLRPSESQAQAVCLGCDRNTERAASLGFSAASRPTYVSEQFGNLLRRLVEGRVKLRDDLSQGNVLFQELVQVQGGDG